MRESRTYGSVRGALSNERPYRDSHNRASLWPRLLTTACGTNEKRRRVAKVGWL